MLSQNKSGIVETRQISTLYWANLHSTAQASNRRDGNVPFVSYKFNQSPLIKVTESQFQALSLEPFRVFSEPICK
jgi:hypothetical protein